MWGTRHTGCSSVASWATGSSDRIGSGVILSIVRWRAAQVQPHVVQDEFSTACLFELRRLPMARFLLPPAPSCSKER
jgi:hypothetical protein